MNEVEGQRKNEKEGKGRSVEGRERWVEGGGKEERERKRGGSRVCRTE